MTNIRRYPKEGNVYFLMHVTHDRLPILIENFDLLWYAIESMKENTPFDLMAWVVLPDHCHMIIDPYDNDLSKLMKQIKLSFSANYRKKAGMRRGRVWQNRFWDRIIRDDNDLNRHLDYIHYNPVKHGLTTDPFEYPHSSIHRYYEMGYYTKDWGSKAIMDDKGEFGE